MAILRESKESPYNLGWQYNDHCKLHGMVHPWVVRSGRWTFPTFWSWWTLCDFGLLLGKIGLAAVGAPWFCHIIGKIEKNTSNRKSINFKPREFWSHFFCYLFCPTKMGLTRPNGGVFWWDDDWNTTNNIIPKFVVSLVYRILRPLAMDTFNACGECVWFVWQWTCFWWRWLEVRMRFRWHQDKKLSNRWKLRGYWEKDLKHRMITVITWSTSQTYSD